MNGIMSLLKAERNSFESGFVLSKLSFCTTRRAGRLRSHNDPKCGVITRFCKPIGRRQ